nr:hypothetical protein [Tanacetum cinerariifolium]
MDRLNKHSTDRAKLLKALNTETLKVIQEAIKEDHAYKKVMEATEAYTTHFTNIFELLSLTKTYDFSGLKSLVETVKAALDAQNDHLETWAMEHVAMEDDTKKPESDKAEEEPTNANPISTLKPIKTQPITTIIRKHIPSHNDEINKHLEKEDRIKKAAKKAKRIEMTKNKVIKIIQEEVEKIGIDPKKVISAKAGKKFKKAQDAEMQVHKRQHTEKIKRLMKLNKKRAEQYKWTISSKVKPESIIDVKIHPNSKPAVLTVYRNNDKRNFDVHNPFKFSDFRLTELDELGPIIQKKKNTIVKDLMKSLGKKYERLTKIPKELGIDFALPARVLEQD